MATYPSLALLSNGTYSVMITDSGAGYSSWRNLDVTRWREDATRDCWGQFCYIRDLTENRVWSTGLQPLGHSADEDGWAFHVDRAEFHRRDGDWETRWSVCIASDADAELRCITLVNHGIQAREVELTHFGEVCLNHRRADAAHPAFAKLFLETEFDIANGAIYARRRPRAAQEKAVWAVCVSAADVESDGAVEFETDRVKFIGRGRTAANPVAMLAESQLTRTTGPVLDPIFSLRRRLRVAPGATARVAFITGAADTRETAGGIAERFRTLNAVDGAFADAKRSSDAELQQLSLSSDDVTMFNQLAAAVIFTNAKFRDLDAIAANRLGQPGLWPHAISGDLPILLACVAGQTDESTVRQLVQWRNYTNRRGLLADLVVLEQRVGDAADRFRNELQSGDAEPIFGKPGGVFWVSAQKVTKDDLALFGAAARVALGNGTTLADRLEAAFELEVPLQRDKPRTSVAKHHSPVIDQTKDLSFWNGHGGFANDGREYVITVDGTQSDATILPPAPWTNVLANPDFGCLVTEGGFGYTWAGNSQMNRLTPWSNDPTSDPPGEVLFVRDEETHEVWSPTPLPCGPRAVVTVRHGQGYTRYVHSSHGLDQDLLVLVAPDDPVKLVCLMIRNTGTVPRRLSATYYAEWVLGTVRENAPLQVVCEHDLEKGVVKARNAWAGSFADKIAFLAGGPSVRGITADRMEFLGRHGSVAEPAALSRDGLLNNSGPGLDPCAAVMTELTLSPGEEKQVVFIFGQADSSQHVDELIAKNLTAGRVQDALKAVQQQWDGTLSTIQVATPDSGIDLMLNRWLVYQVLACRIWARSAFYQSGGAYGFRDQLQDVMALVYSAPHTARAQILRSAARQFEEGDVQHWWHPPSGIGVRTRITDDLYFLPFVVHHYVTTTGDAQLLDEQVTFITSPVLRDEQEEDFGQPAVSAESASIYEHCVRALEKGYRLGAHGLPLMGTGDWNDGMNKVGAEGKGESVWNGWFYLTVMRAFTELAKRRGDHDRVVWCNERVEALRQAIETNAWDGGWYRRAYFDDGTPLGSAQNEECQIDALPQAWAVISGVAQPERAKQAMEAVQQRLVRREDKLIQLFDPPFDKGTLQPGYIKGYVPGIRENGGQYTHAAAWVALATALQGDGDRAVELWNLINPIYHATTPAMVQHYKVEPYVVCADIYGTAPHTGRGGWTWYTGSASWLYRVALETILGFKLNDDRMRVEPCIPKSWPGFGLTYRHGASIYTIRVDNAAGTGRGVRTVKVDGQEVADHAILLCDDGQPHTVDVILG